MFFVTPQLGRSRGGVGVSAERIIGHLQHTQRVHVFEMTDELPPVTYQRSDELTRVSSVGERRVAYQLLCDRIVAEAALTPPRQLAAFYASDLGWAVSLAAKLVGVPFVLFARGNDIDLDPFGESGPRILSTLAEARQVFCVSRELQHKVRRWSPTARVSYVPNGVEPALFTWQGRPPIAERVSIGIFGDLKGKKGLELLTGQLDFDRFSLRIVGNLRAEPEKFLHGFCTLFPERAAFVVHEPFSGDVDALLRAYASVDIVCLPSLHEGMSNVMLEAMSTGAVCVASRVGGAIDVIEDGVNGFLFAAGDEASLGDALKRAAVAAHDLAARVRMAARATVEQHFSAAREAEAYASKLTSDS